MNRWATALPSLISHAEMAAGWAPKHGNSVYTDSYLRTPSVLLVGRLFTTGNDPLGYIDPFGLSRILNRGSFPIPVLDGTSDRVEWIRSGESSERYFETVDGFADPCGYPGQVFKITDNYNVDYQGYGSYSSTYDGAPGVRTRLRSLIGSVPGHRNGMAGMPSGTSGRFAAIHIGTAFIGGSQTIENGARSHCR